MADKDAETRANLKETLKAAKLKIEKTINSVDAADHNELAELRGAVHHMAAFVDFNTNHGC